MHTLRPTADLLKQDLHFHKLPVFCTHNKVGNVLLWRSNPSPGCTLTPWASVKTVMHKAVSTSKDADLIGLGPDLGIEFYKEVDAR